MNQLNKEQAVNDSSLGTELDEGESYTLAERMGVFHLADGEVLVDEGEVRRTLFLLIEGCIDVIKRVGNSETLFYHMQPGECAGARAFVDGTPRKELLRAAGKCTVLMLELDDFESLLESQPGIVYKVMRAIFRIAHTNLLRVNYESTELKNYITRTHARY